MPLDPSAVGYISPVQDVAWDPSDCLLYALSVGAGEEELAFVTENTDGVTLKTVPSMAAMLCQPPQSIWERLGGFDWAGLVHANQEIVNHRPLPVCGAGRATTEIVEMLDKGSAALVTTRTILRDQADDGVIAIGRSTAFIRGAGGFGGSRGTTVPVITRDRRPDHVIRDASIPGQALLYRINGDRNPLHSSPEFARRAGFSRPILHGLCALGFATRALVQAFCADQPELIESVGARFLRPCYPGDIFTTTIWEADGTVAFETRRTGGDVVLANGTCGFRGAAGLGG
jgi:acyl dehydratase